MKLNQRFAMFAMTIVGTLLLSVAGSRGYAQPASSTPTPAGASTEDLQKATQNPVANLISVPFQHNIDWNAGPYAQQQLRSFWLGDESVRVLRLRKR